MLMLATRLRAMDDAALHRALTLRDVATGGIRDFFDLADSLLEPDSVQNALTRLDRGTLAVLAVTGESPNPPTISELAARLTVSAGRTVTATDVAERVAILDSRLLLSLGDDRLTPYDAVTARLRAWPAEGLPSAEELANEPAPSALAPVSDTDTRFTDRLAAESAFSVVSSIAELINELSREPARELSRGGIGLPDSKRLAAAMSVELESVVPLVAIATRAKLIGLDDGHWLETDRGESWLLDGTAARWITLAASWHAALPSDVRGILSSRPGLSWGEGLRGFVGWLYPAGGEVMDGRIAEFARDAELIGITSHHTTSTVGAAVLSGDLDAAVAGIAEALPDEVGQVYLQHDLSIVSPGPLAPSIDARLRSMADVESRELASSYRITHSSVNRALAAGESAESLLEFLRGISLTGIPQPLEYLITDSAARYGRVRVGAALPGDALQRSYVRSDDAALLGAISVDQTLSALALSDAGEGRLTSRFTADVVFWALSDARYPVAAENSDSEIVHLRRHQLARVRTPPIADPLKVLIETLRAGDGGESAAAGAWLARQLDVAIRARQTVTVSIAMPGGVVVDYLLEPASVGGGRFRARDRRADIERTLPLSSIISITPEA